MYAIINQNQLLMKSQILAVLLLSTTFIFAQAAKPNQEVSAKVEKDSIKEKVNALDEVTVTAQTKYIKVDSDKTTIGVKDNSMLNSGSSLEAVKKLPGVITSPTGGISLNGKAVTIYIDGAPSTLSGND